MGFYRGSSCVCCQSVALPVAGCAQVGVNLVGVRQLHHPGVRGSGHGLTTPFVVVERTGKTSLF